MRISKVLTLCFILFLGLVGMTTNAQTQDYDLIMKELTKEQKALLQKEREMIKNNREALKKTLTKEQLSILTDRTLRNDQKRSLLMRSFTKAQRNLVQRQEVRIKATRNEFRKSLTPDQRKILKDRITERSRRNREKRRGNQ